MQDNPPNFQNNVQPELDGDVTVDAGFFEPPSLISLYVGRAALNARRLQEDHEIELSFICLNSTRRALKVAAITGRSEVRYRTNGGSEDLLTLGAPTEIPDRTPVEKSPGEEFMIVLRWQLRPSEADEIMMGLERGMVSFDLREISVVLVDCADPSATLYLPITGGVTMRTADAGELIYNTMTYVKVNAAVSG